MNILIIRFSSLGDVVLQTSLIAWLRSIFGEKLQVTFLTSHEFQPLLTNDPWVKEVISFNRKEGLRGIFKLAENLRSRHKKEGWDLILDVHANTRTFILKSLLFNIAQLTIHKRRLIRDLLTHSKFMFYKKILLKLASPIEPQVYRQLKNWQGIFLQTSLESFQQFIKDQKQNDSLTYLPNKKLSRIQITHPYILISPVASFESKRWPMENYKRLIEMIMEDPNLSNIHVVVVGGPKDDYVKPLENSQFERLHYLQGQTSLEESMSIAQGALFCVGNDSGMNHISEAYNKPVITIFGPTHEAFGFGAHHPQSINLSVHLWCRPCSTTGAKNCFRKNQECMTLITPSVVFENLKKIHQGLSL